MPAASSPFRRIGQIDAPMRRTYNENEIQGS